MKKLVFLIALAVSAFTARAQVTANYATKAFTTPTIAASTTTTFTNLIVDVSNALTASVQCAFTLSGATTNSPTVKFSKSVDGTTFETTPSITLAAVTLNGTTAVNTFDIIDTSGAKYLKLVSVQNGSGSHILTNTVTVGLKHPRPR